MAQVEASGTGVTDTLSIGAARRIPAVILGNERLERATVAVKIPLFRTQPISVFDNPVSSNVNVCASGPPKETSNSFDIQGAVRIAGHPKRYQILLPHHRGYRTVTLRLHLRCPRPDLYCAPPAEQSNIRQYNRSSHL